MIKKYLTVMVYCDKCNKEEEDDEFVNPARILLDDCPAMEQVRHRLEIERRRGWTITWATKRAVCPECNAALRRSKENAK